MSNQPVVQLKSERGIALVVVLLLMAVLSGIATGFAMNGHVEAQMGQNEVYFAGARAAAEAGLNRAIVEILADTSHNLLFGADGAGDDNPAAAVNADDRHALAGVPLDDLVCDAHERAPDVLRAEDGLLVHFTTFLASRDPVKG